MWRNVLVFAVLVGCSAPPPYVPPSGCSLGSSAECECPGGGIGTRACLSTGEWSLVCRGCADASTCATTCGGQCVDTETNWSHCGGCYRPCSATQACVAGVCFSTVAPDVPSGGDSCMSCAQTADCPGGYECGTRRCDGARGCYPTGDRSATCARIGGIACPATSAYNLCSTDSECGPYAGCVRFGDGRSMCARRCTADRDCPAAPTGYSVTPACNTRAPQNCYLRCTGPSTCPYGLSCFRFSDGSYGYCS